MIEPLFNELSIDVDTDQDSVDLKLWGYSDLLKSCFQRIKADRVLYRKDLGSISLGHGQNLKSFIKAHIHDARALFLLTSADHPFIKDGNEEALGSFIDNDIRAEINGKEIDSESFAAAYCLKSFCIGFKSDTFDGKISIPIIIKHGDDSQTDQIFCITNIQQLDNYGFVDWLIMHNELKLAPTKIDVKSKQIHIYDHHGQDIAEYYAKRFVQRDYVDAIPNTIPFQPHAKSFLKKVRDDFSLEIVFYKEKKVKCGLLVKTTARNKREAEYIATLLEEIYS